jgi:hypothetical protein
MASALLTWVGAWEGAIKRHGSALPAPRPVPQTGAIGGLVALGCGALSLLIGLVTWANHGWALGWLAVYEVNFPLLIGVVAIVGGVVGARAGIRTMRVAAAAQLDEQQKRDAMAASIAGLQPLVAATALAVAAGWSGAAPHSVFSTLEARFTPRPSAPPPSSSPGPKATAAHRPPVDEDRYQAWLAKGGRR